jgi:hypothetical protein
VPLSACKLTATGSAATHFALETGSTLMFCSRLRGVITTSTYSSGAQGRRALSVPLIFARPSFRRGHTPWPTFSLAQKRLFAASFTPHAATPHPPRHTSPLSPTHSHVPTRRSVLSRILPASLLSNADGTTSTSASFRKIVAFARPERRPLLTAIGLLLVSSSVSLSIPFTVGKLIDYFTSLNPVGRLP